MSGDARSFAGILSAEPTAVSMLRSPAMGNAPTRGRRGILTGGANPVPTVGQTVIEPKPRAESLGKHVRTMLTSRRSDVPALRFLYQTQAKCAFYGIKCRADHPSLTIGLKSEPYQSNSLLYFPSEARRRCMMKGGKAAKWQDGKGE